MNPNQIQNLTDQNRNQTLSQELLVIWENSVKATNLFLTLQDIEDLRPLVLQGIAEIQHLIMHTQPEGIPSASSGFRIRRLRCCS